MNITTVFSILSVGTHYLLLLVLVKLPLSTADSQQVSSQVTTTVKGRIAVNGFPTSHLTAAGRHLPYGITQCYLLPDTSEHAPL